MSVLAELGSLSWGAWIYTILKAGISSAATVAAANPIATALGAQAFTPRQLGTMALSAGLVAIFGVLSKSPLPDRIVQAALLPGVRTVEQAEKIAAVTASGTVPTPAVVAAIIAGTPPEILDKPEPAPADPIGGKP